MAKVFAIAIFVAGGLFLTQPKRLLTWLGEKAARSQGKKAPAPDALHIPGLLLFMRVIGFIMLLYGVVMLFVMSTPVGPN